MSIKKYKSAMPNYQNGKIYKIVNDIDNELYVGSSIQPLSKRMVEHRSHSKYDQYNKTKLYVHFQKIGVEHFKIVLVELFPCLVREELLAREEYWRKELKASLNSNYVVQSTERYKEIQKNSCKRNKVKIVERHKQYHEINKEKRNEYSNKYYSQHKEQFKKNIKIGIKKLLHVNVVDHFVEAL